VDQQVKVKLSIGNYKDKVCQWKRFECDINPMEACHKEKCTFCENSVVYLGFIVNKHGVHVDPTKVQAI